MPPVNRVRGRAVRAILSALAGGGLTAAGLAGPFASTALGGRNTPTSSSATEVVGSVTAEGEQQTTTTSSETTTSSPSTSAGEAGGPTSTQTTSTQTLTAPSSSATPAPASPTKKAAPGASKPRSASPSTEAPTVVLKRKQKPTSAPRRPRKTSKHASATHGKSKPSTSSKGTGAGAPSGPNGVAASPQAVAAEAGLLAALLASSEASAEALTFYRIPLFLLPIYKAAAVQYGVPWQILAAINEIETDYGSDLSISTAGAEGWMQFMPSTWLQYGVDALNAGYADPYNPVDAVFAAARYLRAAGAATNLRDAIFSYNHSNEYVESVLLRAKLISSYPTNVISTLTGLVDGRLPVTGAGVSWGKVLTQSISSSSATAGARKVASPHTGLPGSTPPLAPAAAAAAAGAKTSSSQQLQLAEVLSAPRASVVAVQDGRVTQIGDSRALGRYLVLRDVDGDVFTYAGLGSVASTYVPPKVAPARVKSPAVEAASTPGPSPSQAASAGTQPPVTLKVTTPKGAPSSLPVNAEAQEAGEEVPAGMGHPRLYAHPGNPDARAAVKLASARKAQASKAGKVQRLRVGSVITSGTVLGQVSVPAGDVAGHMRFAVQPAGDPQTVDPAPVLENWAQLQKALHPRGAKASDALLGATASAVFLMSKPELERAVLSDPGISMGACARHEVAAGVVDKRVLAVLAFLSRSGLEPTVSALHCSDPRYASVASFARSLSGEEVDISAINGTPIAGHQGAETITELTIHTLLSLPAGFVPHEITSLMRFPGAPATHADRAYWNRMQLEFKPPAAPGLSPNPNAAVTAAHSAGRGPTAPAPSVSASNALDALQWSQLIVRVGALPAPPIPSKPTSAAIPDPKHR